MAELPKKKSSDCRFVEEYKIHETVVIAFSALKCQQIGITVTRYLVKKITEKRAEPCTSCILILIVSMICEKLSALLACYVRNILASFE